MVDPLSTLTVLVCSAICMRLITYRRAGALSAPAFPCAPTCWRCAPAARRWE